MKHLFLLSSFLFLGIPFFAHAADGVRLSEIAWAGSSLSNADEWIELVNLSSEDISLAGWSITGAGTSGSALVFPEDAIISASSTFVVANYDAAHENSALQSEPNWVTTSVALSNSALEIVLRDAEGAIVDSVGDGGVPPAGYSGEMRATMSRIIGGDALGSEWESSVTSDGFKEGIADLGTPGSFSFSLGEEAPPEEIAEPEVVPEPTPEEAPRPARPNPIVTTIRISEVYPAPLAGEKEWIELVNISSTGEFLNGWSIEDEKGDATMLEGLMLPWSHTLIMSPKGALNNTGDVVLLKDAEGRIIDGMTYGSSTLNAFPHATKPARGESIIRPEYEDRFVTTNTPTPGSANVETVVVSEPEKPEKAIVVTPAVEKPQTPAVHAVVILPTVAKNDAPAPKTVLVQSIKTVVPPAPKKTVTASRYKGLGYVAVIAVPPGPYGKTRMHVIIDNEIRALHLTKSPSREYHAGERIGFVAQEKEEAGSEFLLANVSSLYQVEGNTEFEFLEATSWPTSAGAYRVQGEVLSVNGDSMFIGLNGEEGIVHAPKSLNNRGINGGDRIEVLGFFSPGTIPELTMPNEEALRSLEPIALPFEEARGTPRWLGIVLLGAVIVCGAGFHLYQERARSLLMEQPLD